LHRLPPNAGAVAPSRVSTSVLVTLAAALSCFSSNLLAQDALLDRAMALLGRHDSAGAYALLVGAEMQRAGEARFDYLLGVAALDSGHVTRAIFALERAVQTTPDNMLAHAELGRAYLAAGDLDSAREELRQARGGDVPEDASAAIDRVIGVINQVAPLTGPQISGYLEFGAGYDSNVNSATNQGEFAIPGFGGILFQTAPENRQQHDLVVTAAGGANVELMLSPFWKLLAAANLRANVDRVVHDMNTVFLDATAGLRHTAGSQSQTIAVQNGTAWVGSSLYRIANGLTAQWQSQIGSNSQASVFGQWSHQAYTNQSERNTDRSMLGFGYAREFGAPGPLAYGSAYVARERTSKAEFANFGHHATGVRLGLEQRLGQSIAAFAEWQHEQRRYGGSEPFFDVARRDRQHEVSGGVRYSAGQQWQLTAKYQHAHAASNVVLYDYSRNVFQITAHRSFQ
jgi:tetratricopeptide (TPR) repeat protein